MPSRCSWRFIALGVAGLAACSSGRTSATSARPASAPSGMQLFLLAGQSNMAGRGKVEAQDSVASPRVLKLDRTMQWVPAVDPLHWDKPAIVGVGPGLSFARALAARDPNVTIGLIPAAVGGSPISTWEPGAFDPSTRTHPYDDALARLRIAQRSGTLRAILWHQGEADATPARSMLYAAKLRALIARFRADVGDPNLPLSDDVRRVDSVHRAIAASVPNVAYVPSEHLRDKGDTVHFDAASARTLGERYAMAYLVMVTK
jgi:hypothetical protein